jgi:hypothetical protein
VTTAAGAFAGGRSAFGGAAFRGFGGTGFRGGFGGRPGLGFGFPAFRGGFGFGRFGFGAGWGFGWGLGFGWGPCWGDAWAWDPFCFGSFAAFPPYGYYDYPPDPYAYPPSVGYDPNYAPGGPGYDPDNPPPPGASNPNASYSAPYEANPNWDTSVNAPTEAAKSQVPVVIYFKDGSSVLPSDYWISANRFHYVLGGQESSVDLSRVDLPHTNDVNHKNGATFWLKSGPDADPTPAAEAPAVAPAAPQNNNAAPGPAAAPQSVPTTAQPVTL